MICGFIIWCIGKREERRGKERNREEEEKGGDEMGGKDSRGERRERRGRHPVLVN